MKITNSPGLSIHFLDNGSVKSIDAAPIRISLKESTPFSPPGANLYLRVRATPMEFTALTGPHSPSCFRSGAGEYEAKGKWAGMEYSCTLRLAKDSMSWQWMVEVKNTGSVERELDLVFVQDVGLKQAVGGPVNEYYVAQYLERRVLEDERYGAVVCCRQNMKEGGGHPWLMMALKNGAVAGSTDGMQFYGKTCRETGIPEALLADRLGGEYAGESPVVALQEKPFRLNPGEEHSSVFAAMYLAHHAKATSEGDLSRLPDLFNEFEMTSKMTSKMTSFFILPADNTLITKSFLPVQDLDDDELSRFFGHEKRLVEMSDGYILSFFSQENNHVALRKKELLADRPHAQILQAGAGLTPDECIMSTTSFMCGVFNSHLTQGNTNFNTLLSICTGPFNTDIETGQRILVLLDGIHYRLGIPSAFEMGLNHCRWIYKYGRQVFQVRTWTSKNVPQVNLDFKVISGDPVGLIITHDFDPLNGWTILPGEKIYESAAIPDKESMIAKNFPDARFRFVFQENKGIKFGLEAVGMESQKNMPGSLYVVRIENTSGFAMSILGEVCSPIDPVVIENDEKQWQADIREAQRHWRDMSRSLSLHGEHPDIASIREILPWYGMNALVHYLTPYGLEQFGGAAWGTRDVSQGPVDMLLTMGKYAEAGVVLKIIFSNQDPGGGWPQWWMFDSYHAVRAQEAHGDIFYWCIIALCNYVNTTGDLAILDEVLPFYHEKGITFAEKAPLGEHLNRLIHMITDSFIPGTSLVPYGGGDWNDSLQPVSSELARRMISSWTVEMNYQAFSEYQQVAELAGNIRLSEELGKACERIKADFNEHLVKDGVVAGYGLLDPDGRIRLMLHPSDAVTGVRYSLLPMERGILSGIFTREQAERHLQLIGQHLKGPDGARLMDRPLKYKGGIQEIFQRAESSTYFGREIGLMYVHEHIRYAEALARTGKADEFVKALRQAIPAGYRDVVPPGDIRQANCYYSSSDVVFRSRYEADERYDEVIKGHFTLRGGWRVYSSGPGIYLGIIFSRFLGLRIKGKDIIIDPVMPFHLDGISVSMEFLGYPVTFHYSVKERNFSPKAIIINDKKVFLSHETNTYRPGGAIIPKKLFIEMLNLKTNWIEIQL